MPGRLQRTRSPTLKFSSAIELKLMSDTGSVIPCAPGALSSHISIPPRASDRAWFILPIPYLVHTSDPILSFRGSIPDLGLIAAHTNLCLAEPWSGCGRDSSSRAQPQGSRRRHALRPCGTGTRRPRFVCRGQPAAAGVPFHIAPRARRVATSGGPAERLSHLGAEGHAFFFRRFSLAMRRSFRNQ